MSNHSMLKLSCWVAAAVVATAPAAFAQDLTSEFSYRIVEKRESGEEALVERDSVRPGEIIQYTLVHENVSPDELSGVTILAPVPEGATITLGDEFSSLPAKFEVQADLEPDLPGLEWSTLPAYRTVIDQDGSIRKELLPETAIAAVRWNLQAALLSGETTSNSYRVIVN